MPIFSYLAYPAEGQMERLVAELGALEFCEVMPAENEEILILVTDTPDDKTEHQLQKTLKQLQSLQSLSMAFGHVDEQTEDT